MAETKCPVLTTLGRKGLLWFMVSEIIDPGQLVPRQGHHGGRVWQRKAMQLMASRKRRAEEEQRGRDRGQMWSQGHVHQTQQKFPLIIS